MPGEEGATGDRNGPEMIASEARRLSSLSMHPGYNEIQGRMNKEKARVVPREHGRFRELSPERRAAHYAAGQEHKSRFCYGKSNESRQP
jgi:hypothetical protein